MWDVLPPSALWSPVSDPSAVRDPSASRVTAPATEKVLLGLCTRRSQALNLPPVFRLAKPSENQPQSQVSCHSLPKSTPSPPPVPHASTTLGSRLVCPPPLLQPSAWPVSVMGTEATLRPHSPATARLNHQGGVPVGTTWPSVCSSLRVLPTQGALLPPTSMASLARGPAGL